MKGTVPYGPRDIRFEELDVPKIVASTDAIIRIAVTCVCGSDLWPYPLDQVAEGYRAMDERRAIKALLRP